MKTKLVMLTMSTRINDVTAALRNGAHAYLCKTEPAAKLKASLLAVMRGEAALSGQVAAKVLAEFSHPSANQTVRSEQLTNRERDVLKGLVDGLSNDQIAARLHLSEATVKKHISRVMAKWHMENRVQVAVHSLREGLVD